MCIIGIQDYSPLFNQVWYILPRPCLKHQCTGCYVWLQSVVALITTDVHNRDIVSSLMDQGTTDVNDFSWQMQLRFECDVDTDTVVARQVAARYVTLTAH